MGLLAAGRRINRILELLLELKLKLELELELESESKREIRTHVGI